MPSGARSRNKCRSGRGSRVGRRGKERALAGRLIQAVKEECKTEPARVAAALSVYRYAKWLVRHKSDHVLAFFADFGESPTWRILNHLRPLPLSLYL